MTNSRIRYPKYPLDHYTEGPNPYGDHDTWNIEPGKFYKKMKKDYVVKEDTRIVTEKDIEEVKNTNYRKDLVIDK